MGLCRGLHSAIVAVETFDFHPFARFEYQHIRYEIVEQSRNKQGGKITMITSQPNIFWKMSRKNIFIKKPAPDERLNMRKRIQKSDVERRPILLFHIQK